MTVLILARQMEPQVDRVVNELVSRDVPIFRTDLSAFPQRLTLDARLSPAGWQGTLFECNPFGAYGWIEDKLGLPISSALADVLMEGHTRA